MHIFRGEENKKTGLPNLLLNHNINEEIGLHEVPLKSIKSGIYLLFNDEELIYIGQSVCGMYRIGSHVMEPNGKQFNRAFFIPVSQPWLDQKEREFIVKLRPTMNFGRNGIPRSWLNSKEQSFNDILKRERMETPPRPMLSLTELGLHEKALLTPLELARIYGQETSWVKHHARRGYCFASAVRKVGRNIMFYRKEIDRLITKVEV